MELSGNITPPHFHTLDVEKYPQWAYSTKSSILIRKIDNNELIYHSEINAPWPLSNRDFYADIKLSCDSSKHSWCLVSSGLKDFLPEKKGLVRIPRSKAVWNISTISDKVVHLQYILQVDPGGCLPSWVANMFATKGPMETFASLRKKM